MEDVLTEIEKAGDAANDAWLKDPQGPVIKHVARRSSPSSARTWRVPRFVRYAGQGYVGQYIHLGGKIGVQVEFAGVTPAIAGRDEFADAGEGDRDADRGGRARRTRRARRCRPTLLEKEKAIYRAQMESSGKPANVHREDHRGQARELLHAGRAARPGVDPRHDRQDERQGRCIAAATKTLGGDGRRSRASRGSRSAKRLQ